MSSRPRPWLLVLLGLSLLGVAVTYLWPTDTGDPVAQVVAIRPGTPPAGDQGKVNPEDLVVRLDELEGARPRPGDAQRNPFRFNVKPPPPAPLPGGPRGRGNAVPIDVGPPPPPPGPPPKPPIPLKFIGIVEKPGFKVAALSDCRTTYVGHEGEVIDGRYRLIRIGVESIVIEYADGTGRTTLRSEGCLPR